MILERFQHCTHPRQRLAPRRRALDSGEVMLQAGGEPRVVVLPILAEDFIQIGASGRDPLGLRAGWQCVAFADLGRDDGGGRILRLQFAPQRFDRPGLAMGKEQAPGDRRAGRDPGMDIVPVCMGRIAVDPPDLSTDGDVAAEIRTRGAPSRIVRPSVPVA